MRRTLPTILIVVVGLLLLADFVIINPSLAAASGVLVEYLVLLSAAVAVAGGLSLVARHAGDLLHRRGERSGSILVLVGMGVMLAAGFYPGSRGTDDPAVLWLVGALLAPLVAALFALLFIFLLAAARRGLAGRPSRASGRIDRARRRGCSCGRDRRGGRRRGTGTCSTCRTCGPGR